jgi:pyrimidine operon attenuation protein/uracil phosphoribosyltransferase
VSENKTILNHHKIDIISSRLCCELIEKHNDFSNSAIVGLQPRGIFFARRIHKELLKITKLKKIAYGELDITFYRDDFRQKELDITPNKIEIDFLAEGKKIILVDDVLFTGRSIRSALDALNAFGRPAKVELMVLIDRRYSRQLPIEPDYVGATVDTRSNDKVKVDWTEKNNKVMMMPQE